MTDIEKIKAKIRAEKHQLEVNFAAIGGSHQTLMIEAYERLLSFIDHMHDGECPGQMSDREIMHKMVDKICDAQSEPDTDGNVDKTRATYREMTSDGYIREIFVHAYSIKK